MAEILKSGSFGDFLLLHLISKNVVGDIFDRIIIKYYQEVEMRRSKRDKTTALQKNGDISFNVVDQDSDVDRKKSF